MLFFKKTFIVGSLLKYALTLLVIIAVVAMSSINTAKGEVINLKARTSLPGFRQTINLFLTMFYFFAGFEIYTTLSQNLKRPKRDLPIAICVTMVVATCFYLVLLLSCLGLMTNDHPNLSKNPVFDIFVKHGKVLQLPMSIMAISAFIITKLVASIEGSFYSNSILSPLAKDQFISFKVSDEKHHLSRHAVLLDFVIVSLFFGLIVFIPDLTSGIDGTGVVKLNYNDIIEISSLFSAKVYFFVLTTVIRLSFSGEIKISWWWGILFILATFFVETEIIFYFVNIPYDFAAGNYVRGTTIIVFALTCLNAYLGVYLWYLNPRLTRLKQNQPALFAQLQEKYAIQHTTSPGLSS